MRNLNRLLAYAIDRRKLKALVLLCQCFVLSLLIGCRAQLGSDAAKYEAEIRRLNEAHATELEEVIKQAEAGLYASQYMPQENMGDAYILGRWLGCLEKLYPGLTDEAKALACWGVINRVESSEYPDNVEGVLLQKGQFNEYDADSEVTEENVTIASNQLSRWLNGDIRPAGSGAVYISVSSAGVELRDAFEGSRHTNYWRA